MQRILSRNFRSILVQPFQRQNALRCIPKSFFASLPDHEIVPMPALSPTMETGSIAKWNLKEGDSFEPGTAICEVETDKATVTYEAQDDGVIAKILVGTGEIAVGQPIMVTVTDASYVSAFGDFALEDTTVAVSAPDATVSTSPPVSTPAPSSAAVTTPIPSITSSGDRVFASPLARKLAKDAGQDISLFVGTGPGGRIVSADIARGPSKVAASSGATAPSSNAVAVQAPTGGVYADFQVAEAARAFASRLVASKQQVPHFHLSVEINMEKLEAVRKELNSDLSVMDFIIKASALSMKAVPDANGSWHDSFVRQYHQVDINIVMGTGAELTIPVIRDVGSKGLKEIAGEVQDFEDGIFAEDGSMLDASKIGVGTFSIHNLGMYGVKSAAPIVLPPQGCALAVGTIKDTVVPNLAAKEGEDNWKVSPVMIATLACDHRVIDGAVGAAWLASFRGLLENPMSMML